MQKISLFLKHKQHSSVFIAYICVGILFGIVSVFLPIISIFFGMGWFIFAILLLILCFWKKTTAFLAVAIIAGILIGIGRAYPEYQQAGYYHSLVGHKVTIAGKINEDVTLGKRGDKQVKITNVVIDNKKLPGVVWISTDSHLGLKRSFQITASGAVGKGFGNYSASIFRAEIISAEDPHTDKAREVRDGFSENIQAAITNPEASLGIGYLVGQKSSLPESLQEQLKIVGLTHVVVASGYNLTILVRFTRRIFAKISKYLAAVSGGLMIAGFMLVTGFSPSMSRAGLVAGLSLAAWYYGRKIHPLILLPFAAAVTVLINPSFMWGDLGWYLSFAAFGGVMLLAPLLQNYFFGPKKPGTLRQILGETISAQIVTMPIIAISFGTFALFALPANILVLPFVPLAMLLVFIAGIATIINPLVGTVFGYPAYFVLHYMTYVVDWFAQIPNASLKISFSVYYLIIFYVALIALAAYMQIKTKHNFRNDNIIE